MPTRPIGDRQCNEDDPAGAHRLESSGSAAFFAAHPLDVAERLGAHADEAELLEGVADLVLVEEVHPAVGQPA